jgi:hypothetical protein
MKLRLSSCGCEARPAKGGCARAGSEPGNGRGTQSSILPPYAAILTSTHGLFVAIGLALAKGSQVGDG